MKPQYNENHVYTKSSKPTHLFMCVYNEGIRIHSWLWAQVKRGTFFFADGIRLNVYCAIIWTHAVTHLFYDEQCHTFEGSANLVLAFRKP